MTDPDTERSTPTQPKRRPWFRWFSRRPEQPKRYGLLNRRGLVTALLTALVATSTLWLKAYGFFQAQELSVYDRYVQWRSRDNNHRAPILLITVTETDIQRYGYPINDELMARLLENLSRHHPAAIGVDIFRDIPTFGRDRLESVLKRHANIVLIEKKIGESAAHPTQLAPIAQLGFSDLVADPDGVIRRALLLIWDETNDRRVSLSLAFYLALMYLDPLGIEQSADPNNEAFFRLGETVIQRFYGDDGGYNNADDGGYQMLMNYAVAPHSFESVDLTQVLENPLAPERIAGKIILIGTTSPSVKDLHETPFSSAGVAPFYGVEIHAQIVDQLIRAGLYRQTAIQPISDRIENLLIFICALLGTIGGVLSRSTGRQVLVIVAAATAFALLPLALFERGYWVPIVAAATTWTTAFFCGILFISYLERLEHKLVVDLFGKFVTKEIAAFLWENRDKFLHGGRLKPIKLTATVIITDLKDYTTAAERLDPSDLLNWLNIYISEMTRIIEAHGGIVEDYAGDGIKATFGVPIPRNTEEIVHDAKQAVNCALEMGRRLAEMHRSELGREFPLDKLRIGICSGEVTAGSIGSEERMSYVTIGDTVNIAARLESFRAEEFSDDTTDTVRILVEESTWEKLGPTYASNYKGEYYLKGKQKKCKIYHIFPNQDFT